jgi:hypothetical protein
MKCSIGIPYSDINTKEEERFTVNEIVIFSPPDENLTDLIPGGR